MHLILRVGRSGRFDRCGVCVKYRRKRIPLVAGGTTLFQEPLSRIALFLDFDGTLVRIADRPDLVVVTPETRAMIEALIDGTHAAVGIVSGRPLAEIDGFLDPLILPGAGSHGVERRDARGAVMPVVDKGAALERATGRLRDYAGQRRLLLEEKRGGCALHFRDAPRLESEARALVDALIGESAGLRAIHGHMVAEVSLAGLDKGSALDAFMGEAPFAGRIPVAIGDDTTDEDAFRAAQGRGGLGIRIGGAKTCAKARFTDIDTLHRWLAGAADSGKFVLETA